jgi:hypothetical protein
MLENLRTSQDGTCRNALWKTHQYMRHSLMCGSNLFHKAKITIYLPKSLGFQILKPSLFGIKIAITFTYLDQRSYPLTENPAFALCCFRYNVKPRLLWID